MSSKSNDSNIKSSHSSSSLSSSFSSSRSSSPSEEVVKENKDKNQRHSYNHHHHRRDYHPHNHHHGSNSHKKSRSRSYSDRKHSKQQDISYDQPKKTINSTITVISKPVEKIKGRGSMRQDTQGRGGGLLAWEDDDYIAVNRKLMNSAYKFKPNTKFNSNPRDSAFDHSHNHSKTEGHNPRKSWRHDKYKKSESPKSRSSSVSKE